MSARGVQPDRPKPAAFVRGLGLVSAVALIVGNMVGTSVYNLPAALAKACGPLGLVAWGVTALGYLFVALTYAALGARHPRTGGPYVFARAAFGDLPAFLVCWSYWVSSTIGNASIALGAVAYASPWFGGARSRWTDFALAQALVWGLCWLNVRGVRAGARAQIALLALNVVPLIALSCAMLGSFDARNLQPFAPHGWSALPAGVALVVWAYCGVESATVPAEEVAAPERTIRRATMLGYALGTLAFFVAALAVAGAVPNATIADEDAQPLALAAAHTLGPWAASAIGIAAVAAACGTLNGWILMVGRIPVSAASDGLFFPALARLHPRHGTPHVALIVGALVTSVALALVLVDSLLGAWTSVVALSVLTSLVPHLVTCIAHVALAWRAREARRGRDLAIGALGVAFTLYAISGLDGPTLGWGALALVVGLPAWLWLRAQRGSRTD